MSTFMRIMQLKLKQSLLSGEFTRCVAGMGVVNLLLASTLGGLFADGGHNAAALVGILPLSLTIFMVVFLPQLDVDDPASSWLTIEPVPRATHLWLSLVYPMKLWGISLLVAFICILPAVLAQVWDGGVLLAGFIAGLSLGAIGIGIYRSVGTWLRPIAQAMPLSVAIVWLLFRIDEPDWLKVLQFLLGTNLTQAISGLSLYRHYTALASGYWTSQDGLILAIYLVGLTLICRWRLSEIAWQAALRLKKIAQASAAMLTLLAMGIGLWASEHLPTHGVDISQNRRYSLNLAALTDRGRARDWQIDCRALPAERLDRTVITPNPRWAVIINDAPELFTATSSRCPPEARVFNHLSLTITHAGQARTLTTTALSPTSNPLVFADLVGLLASMPPAPPLTLGVLALSDSNSAWPAVLDSRYGPIRVLTVSNLPADVALTALWENPDASVPQGLQLPVSVPRLVTPTPPWSESAPWVISPSVEPLFKPQAQRQFELAHPESAPVLKPARVPVPVMVALLALLVYCLLVITRLSARYVCYRERAWP
jgi:hypothetical protein